MFTLHTATPSNTEPLSIPKLCLVGKSASTGTSIDFSHIEVVANMNLWPSFHNGVAAGLRLSLNAIVDSTWILFNKPKVSWFFIRPYLTISKILSFHLFIFYLSRIILKCFLNMPDSFWHLA